MTRKYLLIFLLLFTGICQPVVAQQIIPCVAEEQFLENAKHDPSLIQKREQLERGIAYFTINHSQDQTRTAAVARIIPVVVHVLHQCGSENISKEQILDGIRIINEDFRRLNADTANTPAAFRPVAADCNIEFRLAQIDPDGNCTDGIERYETPRTNGWIPRDSLKRASRYWPSRKYLNIWIVKSIDPQGAAGTVLGYAQFPGGDSLTDGIVVRSDRFGNIGTANTTSAGRTTTHEVGHWLSLRPIWGDDNGSCAGTDLVGDTPNQGDNSDDCPNFPLLDNCTTTGNGIMFMNYMDYSDGSCENMFTLGQLTRMNATLAGTRANIISPSNLAATGTDGTPAITCMPAAEFCLTANHLCSGDSIQFTNCTANADTLTYSWLFPNGTPPSSSAANPYVRYTTLGDHDVTLIATSSAGIDTIIKTGIVTVHGNAAFSPNYADDFETAGTFPGDGYIINSDAGNTWQRVTNAGFSGTASIKMNNFSGNTRSEKDEWVLPSISTLNYSLPQFTFKLAYAQRDISKSEKLEVYVSTTCGKLWNLRKTLSGVALATAAVTNSSFTPSSSSDWRSESVNILAYGNRANVRIKFVFTSEADNNLYIDDINLTATPVGIDEANSVRLNFSVFPNPASGEYHLVFETMKPGKVEIKIHDLLGREIKSISHFILETGLHDYTMNAEELGKGIYYISLAAGDNSTARKLVIE